MSIPESDYLKPMTVKTPARESYHHGNLPEVLMQEAVKLLAERGADGFSMREVARRSGVAVAAPSHHFGNARGLLTAIAAEGFGMLCVLNEKAVAGSEIPKEQALGICRAYLKIFETQPGHSSIMFRLDLLDRTNPLLVEKGRAARQILFDAIARGAPEGTSLDMINDATNTVWVAMHGLQGLTDANNADPERVVPFMVEGVFSVLKA